MRISWFRVLGPKKQEKNNKAQNCYPTEHCTVCEGEQLMEEADIRT